MVWADSGETNMNNLKENLNHAGVKITDLFDVDLINKMDCHGHARALNKIWPRRQSEQLQFWSEQIQAICEAEQAETQSDNDMADPLVVINLQARDLTIACPDFLKYLKK